MKKNFRYSLENFRGVSIIFVMLSHMLSMQNMGEIGSIFYYIVGDATAWFVFISGYLFYYLETNKFDYLNYLSKKFKFVVLPYLILSVPAILFWIYLSQNVLYGLTPSAFFVWSLIVGGIAVGPMWFIPMILIFFILSPIFNLASKNKSIYLIFLLSIIFSIFSSRPINNTNPMLSFFHFLGFYIFGIVVAKNSELIDKFGSYKIIILIILGFSVFFLLGFFIRGTSNGSSGFFSGLGELNYVLIGKLVLLIAIFLLFERFFERKNVVLGYFAKISFGLFFIHGFMGMIFQKLSQKISFSYPMTNFLCEVLAIIFGSVFIVFLVKKILGKWSRYVIGC